LLFRYGTSDNGALRKKAHIYTQEEHGIDASLVDRDALWVVRRLRQGGFHAYIVGGAVRDLLVGRSPKDFDIATDAHPQQIRRLFRSARIIGRRFRIVHVYCSPQKYFEVTTFRALGSASDESDAPSPPENNNLFGTIEEDAERRDFTINALYYCPIDRQLLDYVNGLPDVRQKRLRTLVAADVSFAEDPVRIIRAVKYASLLGFSVPLSMAGLIRRTHRSLLTCSRERITEEMYKILTSAGAGRIFELSLKLGVFDTILPAIAGWLRAGRTRFPESAFGRRVALLDERAQAGQLLDRAEMFSFLFQELLVERKGLLTGEDPHLLVQQYLREVSTPLFPSRKDLMVAADLFLKEYLPHHVAPPPRGSRGRGHPGAPRDVQPRPAGTRRRRRGGRRRGGRGHAPAAPPA
jgi:poly(A) polymerase